MKIDFEVPTYRDGYQKVEGEFLFDLAPHLAEVATFAVHKEPGLDPFYWNVTNIETGLHISKHWQRGNAIREASRKLKGKTVADFLGAYKLAAKQYPHLKELGK